MRNLPYIITLAICVLALACTHYKDMPFLSQEEERAQADSVPHLSRMRADSLVFRLTHHYTKNHNFRVKADSLLLAPGATDIRQDTFAVYKGDIIAVAEIIYMPSDSTDSVWVKVARDQATMGWIREAELLPNVVTDDIISETIHFLTGSRAAWMLAIIAFGTTAFFLRRYRRNKLQILKFNEMDSFYPILFLILTASLSHLYSSIQIHTPEYWQEFYFHPTLNPLQLPTTMALLVTLAWSVIIVFIAVVDDVYHNLYIAPGIMYLMETLGLGMIVYLIFSWTAKIGIGNVMLPLFVCAIVWFYFRYIRCTYICGECGYRMYSSGRCRHCGTYNSEN
jgi:hypothetical protein